MVETREREREGGFLTQMGLSNVTSLVTLSTDKTPLLTLIASSTYPL